MNAGFQSARRAVARLIGSSGPDDAAGPSLERSGMHGDAPRLVAPTSVEGGAGLARREVPGSPAVGFAAFLDGTQESRVLDHVGGVPIVHGTVAAVIRERRERRLRTHGDGPLVERAVYLPVDRLPHLATIDGCTVVDTGPIAPDVAHPMALLERAVHVVQERRERLERTLAERWCDGDGAGARGALWIDGGLAKSPRVAGATGAIGVVKSHHTLYADGAGLAVIAALAVGERTTVVRVTSKQRTPVRSWYLRVRASGGRGPLWGLVRVEVADIGDDVPARADTVSQWILAESSPLSRPDPRWDTLTYGVRDCEEFLRAVS
jgi:hypothetical protein